MTVNGDLIINGTTTTVNTTTVSTTDSLIKLANNNTSGDSLDIGFYGVAYTGGQVTYQGLARQAGTNNFLLFKGLTQDPSGNTLGGGSATAANVGTLIANVAGYSITSNGVDLFLYTTNAYTQANTGVTNAATADSKAVTAGNYANSAYTQANTATTNASTADSKAVTAGSYANSAFGTANSSASYANGAFLQANASFLRANTPDAIANSAALYANGAFIQANAAFLVANTPDPIANSAALYANGAFLQANASFGTANSAALYANAAFAKANTFTGSTTIASSRLTYTATAGQTLFTAPTYVLSSNQVSVYINGVKQYSTDYTETSTTSITLTTGATLNDSVLVEVNGYTTNPYGQSATITDDTTTNATRYPLLATVTSGGLTVANTSSTKLTFNPSTGTLTVPTANVSSSLSLNGVGFDVSNVFTTASTAQVSVDSFATATYRSARYFVQMTSSTSYHIIELFLVHDGTTVYLTQYGEVFTGSSLGTFDASITTGTLNLLFTATNAITTVKLIRRSIVV